MPFVADYSWARPAPSALQASDFIGAVRYLGPGNGGRDITASELRTLHDAGLGVGFVWETSTTASLAGNTAGRSDAAKANHYADALGVPDWVPIFMTVDTDVSTGQIRGPIADYFRGAVAVSKRPIRPYGEADLLDILCGELRLMDCGWQTAAWSQGKLSNYRCMRQRWPPIMNNTVDVNDLGPMPTDFLWHPQQAFDTKEWSDMATEDEVRALVREEIGTGVSAVIDAIVNIQNNLAGLVREQAVNTQLADEAQTAGVRDQLATTLANLKTQGVLAEDVDVDKVAADVAARLEIGIRDTP